MTPDPLAASMNVLAAGEENRVDEGHKTDASNLFVMPITSFAGRFELQ
jgi:hypothetical protein